jgi:hypothetical protein
VSQEQDLAAGVTGPHPGAASSSDTRIPQVLSGTTGEDHNDYALATNRMATLMNGSVAIRIRLAASAGLSTQVAATDIYIPAGGRYDWLVQAETAFVYAQADDGATAWNCNVFTSSLK